MKRNARSRRVLSLLLTLALLLSAAPAAMAAEACPEGGSHRVTDWEIIREANCHEVGTRRGVCSKCDNVVYEDIPIDRGNHDAIYTDNGDGLTHSVRCTYDGYTNSAERHTFEDGRCVKCMAVDYSQAKLSLPERTDVYVDLDDPSPAPLSVGDIRLLLGTADITDEYMLSYNWYYLGSPVGSGATYQLPASVTGREADYEYVCVIMATAKNGSGKTINGSFTVAVHVCELIEAYAAVGVGDEPFYLDETNSRTGVSVEEQIYDQVYDASDSYPSHVVFGSKPSSKVGELNVKPGSFYEFDDKKGLQSVSFEADESNTGAYVINYTAYDTKGRAYPGTLTINVEQSLGDMDVLYTTTRGSSVDLSGEDFEAFWLNTYDRGALTWVSFTDLPSSSKGVLYCGYTSASRPGTRVKPDDLFYLNPTKQSHDALDDVTFVPDSRYTGYVTIPFEAYGENNRGVSTYLSGSMCVFVSEGAVRSVNYSVTAGGAVQLRESDFLSVYQSVTGSKDTSFYIQLLEVPAYGTLYLNYSGSTRDIKLTAANVASYPLSYSGGRTDGIGSVTYLPGSGLSETVRYVAYSAKGALLYVGTISFGRGDLNVAYSSGVTGVSFASADFERALGLSSSAASGTYLSFTPPTQGTLTYTKTGSAGTAVTANDKFYLGTDLVSVSNLRYTPRAGQSGVVSIPFTVYQPNGVSTAGAVRITVRTAYTKSFTDVKSGQWFYTYVMDLAEAGIIGGMTPTTYQPDSEVTYGQALKLIMMAAGYPEQAPTGKNWASGYLTAAVRDGLLPGTVTESYLDRKIDRYTIATIAAKAMRLPLSTATVSPFSDMGIGDPAAPYVMALYEAKILEGTTLSNGKVVYYGVNSITRSQMAAIVWRINNYGK